MRRETPPSVPPELSLASPFSISTHSIAGAMASAEASASRRLRSVSPKKLVGERGEIQP
ncbi:MAG: hypothetical protein IPM60_15430 [Rhodospirillales bacterium]|nr:hypothetical protein [Rhodospirillales bacterium]